MNSSTRKCAWLCILLGLLVAASFAGSPPDNLNAASKSIASRLTFPYSQGWLGADDAYSIPIGKGKSIWLFGDTFIGDPNTTVRSKSSPMMRNSVGISTCRSKEACTIQYYWRNQGTDKPRSFFDSGTDDEWYWPLDGYLKGDALYVSLLIVRNKPGAGPTDPFGFEIAGSKWTKVTNLSASPDKWAISMKTLTDGSLWPGSSMFRDGHFLMLYSQVREGDKGYMTVQRVPLKNLDDPAASWEYLGKDGKWKAGVPHDDAQRVIDQAISEMSVRYHPPAKKWIALSPGPEFPSKRTIARLADSPIGPWSESKNIFEFPEMDPNKPGYDKDTFCYATKEHVEFDDTKIVLTYACNSGLIDKVIANMELYRPRVVVLDIPK